MKNICVLKFLSIITIVCLMVGGSFPTELKQGIAAGYPQLSIHFVNNSVFGFDWPIGANITITIDDPGTPDSPDFTDSPVAWDAQGRWYYLDLGTRFQLQLGQTVTMTDGSLTKSISIYSFSVSNVDALTDTVSGQTAPYAYVVVEFYPQDSGIIRHTTANSAGYWTVDFSIPGSEPSEQQVFDITNSSIGQAYTIDDDGDTIQVDFSGPDPWFAVRANQDLVEAYEWELGETLTLQIDGQSFDATVGQDPVDPNLIVAYFNLSGVVDIQPGDTLGLTNGFITKTTIVTDLAIIDFDIENDVIAGIAPAGSSVDIWACDPEGCSNRIVTASEEESWTANFGVVGSEGQKPIDLLGGAWIDAMQGDEDGEMTMYGIYLPNPWFDVRANEDRVETYEWTFGETITLQVGEQSFETTVGEAPWDANLTYAAFNLAGVVDIQPGDTVSVSNGTITKTTVVTDLAFTDIDIENDVVIGVASPFSSVNIWACDFEDCPNRTVTANEEGIWTADFGETGSEGQRSIDIISGTWIDSSQVDEDGDTTMCGVTVQDTIIRAWPNRDQVDGEGWTIGSTVYLNVEGHQFDTTVEPAYWNATVGVFTFDLSGIVDIRSGTLISLTDGTITKTTTVTNIEISSVDVLTDSIIGKALPGSSVDVYVNNSGLWFVRRLTTNEDGIWIAKFAEPGNHPDEQIPVDIGWWTWIEADQKDEDSDLTLFGTLVPAPYDIFTKDIKSGKTSQQTSVAESGEYNPSWSPDGKYILYDSISIGYSGVYITNLNTGVTTPLPGASGGFKATWSPNGKWIAFDRRVVDFPNLYYVPATGGEKILLREDAIDASWAPNSLRLAFLDLADGNKIKTISLSGSGETVVADEGARPSWSPDGEWIAFEWNGNIWKVRVNMKGEALGDPIQLTTGSENNSPTWSADSSWIIYRSGLPEFFELWKIPVTGGTAIKVVGSPEFVSAGDPAYSFNGRYIAFCGIASNTVERYRGFSSNGNVQLGIFPKVSH